MGIIAIGTGLNLAKCGKMCPNALSRQAQNKLKLRFWGPILLRGAPLRFGRRDLGVQVSY